jgi:CheY-like chemotaxis protein
MAAYARSLRQPEEMLALRARVEELEHPLASGAVDRLSMQRRSLHDAPAASGGGSTRPRAPDRRLRVLLVDDDVAVRAAVGAVLEEGGLCVAQAGTGSEALTKLNDGAVDVVLLDLSIPDAPVRTFIPRIKMCAPDARVLLFSGREIDSEVARLADGIVQKPAFAEELFAAIQRTAAPRP